MALFGRSVSRVVRTGTIGIIVFCSFFGGDSVNLLLFYTIYAQLWQRECEIPCTNEIENVDNVRAGVALATGLLVALTVIPIIYISHFLSKIPIAYCNHRILFKKL